MKIPADVNFILQTLMDAGFEAFIVGGCVRDMLLQREPHDFDVTTAARPEQVRELFDGLEISASDGRRAKVFDTGIKHGTVTVLAGGGPVEVTTYRTEGQYSDGRHPDFVEFTGNLRDDLGRRDFTMNALAWNPEKELTDFFGGCRDIEAGCIRAVGDADKRFKEDALRILRAVRFASVLGFEIEPETEKAMTENRELLKKISAERIREELTGLLTGKNAGRTILKYADVICVVMPELLAMKGFDQKNPHHIYDILEHSAVCVDNIRPEPHLRWAALLHDVGKPGTFTLDEKGTGHFYGHAARSEELSGAILRRLRFDNDTVRRVKDLVKHHDLQIELTQKSVRRALNKLGEGTLRDLILLKRADNLAQSPDYLDRQQYYTQLEELLEQVLMEKQCFSLKDLAVDGNDLIRSGITDGRCIGQTLKKALEKVIDGAVPNEKEALLNWAGETLKQEKTYVIGHKNPDADSVCSAIGFARLRGCTPARAGQVNSETEYILNRFSEEVPELLENLAGLNVILVDHNQINHAAAGMKEANVIEIVDHHFMGGSGTIAAQRVHNQILGSTATIVYQMYREEGIIPDRETAGLLLGAIISDTLFFRSPTAMEEDRQAAEALAVIAETDMEEYAAKIFEAGSNLTGKTVKEVFYGDYKVFSGTKASFGCGALTLSDASLLEGFEREMLDFMAAETEIIKKEGRGPDFLVFMLTSMMDNMTVILCGDPKAAAVVKSAYLSFGAGSWEEDRILRVSGILSRKLQLVPQVTASADKLKNDI